MRYKCICSYNGAAYSGSQRQNNARTIQGEIEKALKQIYNQPITIHPASRTDKGVHAISQTFHYDCDVAIELTKLSAVINRRLPDDIRITSASIAADDFHARYDVVSKTYCYRLSTAAQYDVFSKDTCYQYNKPVDITKIKALAAHFIGKRDFKAFMAAGSDKINTVRTIYAIEFSQTGDELKIEMSADGFLYNMVRIMVGLFLDYSENKKTEVDILKNFSSGNRHYFKHTAPACGLYLTETNYNS